MGAILVSNSFPFALIRRRVVVEPRGLDDLLNAMKEHEWISAWGHENTVFLAGQILGADLRPKTSRPAIILDGEKFPSLDGRSFRDVWLLSPEYAPGFRPAIGQEVPPDAIKGWQVLHLEWTSGAA